MDPVISVNLNGNAYQIEQDGYATLRAYLDRAAHALEDNPDKTEILADLEQAIADKCQRTMGPHKTVVTKSEIAQVLEEMGPVDGANGESSQRGSTSSTSDPSGARATTDASRSKRLYQIREGAMISGVCTGLAAYLHIDVTIIRIAFLFLAFWGIGVILYGVLMFVIPPAKTDEQVAAAHGEPFNAKEVIDQVKRNAADFRSNGAWRRHIRDQRRHWRQEIRRQRWDHAGWRGGFGPLIGLAWLAFFLFFFAPMLRTREIFGWPLPPDVPIGVMAVSVLVAFSILVGSMFWTRRSAPPADPFTHFIGIGLFFMLIFAEVSLFKTGRIFGWPVPVEVPIWAAAVGLVVLYHLLAASLRGGSGADGVVGLAVLLIVGWFAYDHVPAFHDFVQRMLEQMELIRVTPK